MFSLYYHSVIHASIINLWVNDTIQDLNLGFVGSPKIVWFEPNNIFKKGESKQDDSLQ